MPTSLSLRPQAASVTVGDDALTVILADGRARTVPTAWLPRLAQATPEQRADWRLIGDGSGIHWEAIDEDISVAGLLGLPSD